MGLAFMFFDERVILEWYTVEGYSPVFRWSISSVPPLHLWE